MIMIGFLCLWIRFSIFYYLLLNGAVNLDRSVHIFFNDKRNNCIWRYVFHLIRYASTCLRMTNFKKRGQLLTNKLIKKRFLTVSTEVIHFVNSMVDTTIQQMKCFIHIVKPLLFTEMLTEQFSVLPITTRSRRKTNESSVEKIILTSTTIIGSSVEN